jgi:peptide methionine sulfoxide reductase MsrA
MIDRTETAVVAGGCFWGAFGGVRHRWPSAIGRAGSASKWLIDKG